MTTNNINIDTFTVELTITDRGEYNSRIFEAGKLVAAMMDLRSCNMGFCPVPHLPQELSELKALSLHIEAMIAFSTQQAA